MEGNTRAKIKNSVSVLPFGTEKIVLGGSNANQWGNPSEERNIIPQRPPLMHPVGGQTSDSQEHQ